MPHDGSSAAAAAPPLAASGASPEQEPTWSRRDDKLLELVLFAGNTAIHDASNVLGKTPAQMQRRYSFMFEEIRRVLEALYVETPREWDDTEITAAAATAEAPAAAEEEAPGAVVPAAQAQPVAAAEDCAAATVAGGGGRGGNRPVRKKKKPEKWTDDEHRFFLAGLDKYRGNWNVMSREYLTNKTASQIASHYQKYRKREKQRERNQCKRASIHDITEPGSATSAAVAGGAAAAPRKDDETTAGGQDDEPREPAESGESGLDPVEEFPWCR